MMNVCVLLFDDFETLDVFGPVEILGRLKDLYTISFYSLTGGVISNSHGVSVSTFPINQIPQNINIFLIPGGWGTRKEIYNVPLIDKIKTISEVSTYVLCVCTGSTLLAATGLLDGKNATSNKRSFEWVLSTNTKVNWIRKARWVVDGKFYTSSGVSAGMDMTLGFLSDRKDVRFSKTIAKEIEYIWNTNKDEDTFS